MSAAVIRLLLAIIVATACVIPLARGIFRSYIEHSDPDIVFSYQGLQLNDGDSKVNAEHTGYVYFVLLAFVLRLARVLGFIGIDRITPLQTLDAAAFDAAYGSIIFVGRGLSILISAALVVVMFFAGRAASRTNGGGLIAAALTAASWGTATQSLILRTELLSATFTMIAFTALVGAARAVEARNALLMLVAGLAAALAAATKLQAIGPLLCVASAALFFGERPGPYAGRLTTSERSVGAALLMLTAAAVALPAATMLVTGMIARESPGLYQAAIAVYLAALMLAYSVIHHLAPVRALMGASALALGFGMGVLSHALYPNPVATDAMAAFVEHMKAYSGLSAHEGAPFLAILQALTDAGLATVKRRLQGISLLSWPFRIVEWLVIIAVIVHAARREWRTAILTALLLSISYAVEIWSRLRGLSLAYLVYIDPWLALAAATAAGPLSRPRRGAVYAVVAASVVAVMILQLSASLQGGFIAPVQERANACYQAQTYMARLASQFEQFCPGGGGDKLAR